jgi:hypothetical protein
MVMMHELAHNKQMNHSKQFWAVRNELATEMKGLWDKGYTGEGLWGKGVLLENGALTREDLEEGETLPDHLCGGGFRSRGKKRKLKPKITYRERRERQEQKINAKYGFGMALGGDEETRVKLEKGKRPLSGPKRANTTRGRELRAAAALARFETKEEESKPHDGELFTDSEAEDEGEDDIVAKSEPDDAVDVNGKPLLDTHGRHMVRICKEEDKDDEDAKKELWELQNMGDANTVKKMARASSKHQIKKDSIPTPTPNKAPQPLPRQKDRKPSTDFRPEEQPKKPQPTTQDTLSNIKKPPEIQSQRTNDISCSVCSVDNKITALTCSVCANVLQPNATPNTWRCDSKICKDSTYINAGDVGLCGVCGTRKCPS